jgi:hypothetical protein
MRSFVVASLFTALALCFPVPDHFERPNVVQIGTDCRIDTGRGDFADQFTSNGPACLWLDPDDDDNMHFCVTANGDFARGLDYGDAPDGCKLPTDKRAVEDVEDSRVDVKFLVPFAWRRRDEKLVEKQVDCGPEIRVKIDGEVVAHTDASGGSASDSVHFPVAGEAEFKLKVSVTKGIVHKLELEYRDGENCDVFDDDDDAESRTFTPFPPLFRTDGLNTPISCKSTEFVVPPFDGRRRNVESSSSSSSSGTSVEVTDVREVSRFFCVALNQAVLARVDDSSSSSSSSSSSDDDDDSK